jgi:lipoate-protein ligase A
LMKCVELLPFASADGATNMACDEVMLQAVTRGRAVARFYTWQQATLSLGYFQRHQDRTEHPQWRDFPMIRRATGGGAILHDGDLTYALGLPSDWTPGRTPKQWHDHLHDTLARALSAWGIDAVLQAGVWTPGECFSCFARPQPGDIVLRGKKIVGGAQRLKAGAVLQHGSIQLPGVSLAPQELAKRWFNQLGWTFVPTSWTEDEQSLTEQLIQEKYQSASWNFRR